MNNEKIGDIIFSCIEITDESSYNKYRFRQDLWNYTEFTRLKDIKKYIKSIKKNLIGKTLDKVLFLDDLDNCIYIFKKGLWHSYDETEKQFISTYEPYWEDNASAPIVLQFEGNNLEIDVSEDAGRSFDGPNYVRLGYNTIKYTDEIEKRFKGVNHSVRFKNIIGQKLTEIIFEHKCNNIEFKFENGYGCRISTDTCADYGTQFSVITPEMYAKRPHRLFAYKENKTSDWTMEILTGERTSDKYVKEYGKDKYKYWISPCSLNFEPDYLKKYKQSGIILNLLNFYKVEDSLWTWTWIYIPDTGKFYHKGDIIPEPNAKPTESIIDVNIKIDYESIERYFEYLICENYLSYSACFEFEIKSTNKNLTLSLGNEYYFRKDLKIFINNLENNIPALLCNNAYSYEKILFAYPKDNNKIRIAIRSDLFDEQNKGKYIFDYVTKKDKFIFQLKNGLKELTNAQYLINKKIKQYIKENNLNNI